MIHYPSKLVEESVHALSRLPGIGRKTALRLVLHLLKEDAVDVEVLGNALIRMRSEITYCKRCHNISDSDLCEICADTRRDGHLVCLVQDVRDVIAIEGTHQYRGLYHVVGGVISPMEGMGPDELNINSLIERVSSGQIKEVIMALPATMEGDTTNFFIYKKLKDFDLIVSTIARGVSVGDELEYADEITLGRSILNRTPYAAG